MKSGPFLVEADRPKSTIFKESIDSFLIYIKVLRYTGTINSQVSSLYARYVIHALPQVL